VRERPAVPRGECSLGAMEGISGRDLVVWVVGIALIFVTGTYLWGRRFLLVTGLALLVAAGWLFVFVLHFHPPWQPIGVPLEGEPEIGVVYRVKVLTHCGLRDGFRMVEFDGDRWAISGTTHGDGWGNLPPGFNYPSDEGTITLTSPDTGFYTSEFGERRELTRGDELPLLNCL
jgi:hypothetical protein